MSATGVGPASAALASDAFRTVALSGTPAPGMPEGVTFFRFENPAINNAGQVAFDGSLDGPDVTVFTPRIEGIWSEGAGAIGSPALIARTGSQAPGRPDGVNFTDFGYPVINAAGQTAFRGFLSAGGLSLDGDGVWSEGAGSIGRAALVAGAGDQAPGAAPGVVFTAFDNPVLNAAGQTAFRGVVDGPGIIPLFNNEGVWSEAAGAIGNPTLINPGGTPAPGAPEGVNFIFSTPPSINAAGETAFTAALGGDGVTRLNNIGVWSETTGSIGSPALAARKGDFAPGTTGFARFDNFSSPALNDAGQITFFALLDGPDIETTNDSGLWSEAAGSLGNPALIAREGDPAPGTADGVNYWRLSGFVLNAAGETAFKSQLIGPGVDTTNDSGVWSEAAGSIGSPALVARAGTQAPGTPDGVNFLVFSTPSLNAAGQIAFEGILTGTEVDDDNDRGIWASEPNGELTLVVRNGDQFDVSDTAVPDLRTIASANLVAASGNQGGQPSLFNDAGELVFRARFTDGSEGIFVATIPEPAAALAAAMLGLLAAGRRRTRRGVRTEATEKPIRF
ncbi:MAG: choice-of-anchor tandem repeat NxxGxxAF-containing protein [Planctomycetota bacterium]